MRIFATFNIKGGVGKTASVVNLAYLSAADGFRTLIWDLDPQGASTFYFRIRPRVKGGSKKLVRGNKDPDRLIRATDFERLDLLPADFSYRNFDRHLDHAKRPAHRLAELLQPLDRHYDHLFLDCAPSISLMSEGIFVAADYLLVPTIPTTLSLRTLEQLEKHLKRSKKRYRPLVLPFYCMVDRRKNLHRSICQNGHAKPSFLNQTIPYASQIERMGLHRAPIFDFARSSPPAKAYVALWREIRGRIEQKEGMRRLARGSGLDPSLLF